MKKTVDTMSVAALEAAVRRHNRRYFVDHRPEISDAAFDRLVEALRRRKPDSPVLATVGSDLRVGERATIRHLTPMLSLDKCYDTATAMAWAAKFDGTIIAMPKIDGCAVSLRYDAEGTLTVATTRGNGLVGEESTANVRHIADIPKKVVLATSDQRPATAFEIRGEIYLPLSVFRADYAATFANPRNLAAGAIKQKDPRETGAYRLRFWAYDLLQTEAATEVEKRERLARIGFPVVEWQEIRAEEISAVFAVFQARRSTWDFETDGVVFRANSVAEQERLGTTIHHPRFAIAYKFPGDSGTTRLVDVVWSVSRTGTITPVGLVEPVELSGATVTRVSLHHYGMITKLGVTKGAMVAMTRRGGVIPNLESVVAAGTAPIAIPTECPSCGAPVAVREDFLYCTNATGCLKAKIGELKHFMQVIDCEGFGDKLLEQLVTNGLVTDAADFYTLRAEDLRALQRMGTTLAAKLIGRIQERRAIPLDLFLRALGIRELAKRTSQLLAGFGTVDRILALTTEELAGIHGVGPVTAREVVDGLKTKRPLIKRLLKQVQVSPVAGRQSPVQSTAPLAGKRVLFTGTLVAMERKKAISLVEEAGGVAASAVTKGLDYLVVGAGGGAGSKLAKAQALVAAGAQVRILTENEFLKLMGGKA